MKIKTRSILQELNDYASNRDTEFLIDSRATNVIKSAINLIEHIKTVYDEDTASELERRLINSIKGQDPARFSRGIRKITESKRKNAG